LFSDLVRARTRWIVVPLVRLLARANISPNFLTLLGYVINIGVAWVLATGRLQLGGVLVLFAGLFDSFDGALAREAGRTSRFGAFLDSVLDRFSEATVFFGLFWYAYKSSDNINLILIYAAVVGSLIVSYARARAEGIGVECKAGWFTRFERLIILVAGLLLNQLRLALWVLAIFANLTAVQRVIHVWKATRGGRE
jgi:CDP-diacylglycerol--glycerol-3-phosphate 3-phosphatidyltransferase